MLRSLVGSEMCIRDSSWSSLGSSCRLSSCILCGLSVCVGHLSASVQHLRHLLHNTEALLVFQATFSHVSPSGLTSTTQPLATVPGYQAISTIGYEPRLCVSGGLRRLLFLLSASAVESTHIFSAVSCYCRRFLLEVTLSQPALLIGPGLITWALGCTSVSYTHLTLPTKA